MAEASASFDAENDTTKIKVVPSSSRKRTYIWVIEINIEPGKKCQDICCFKKHPQNTL